MQLARAHAVRTALRPACRQPLRLRPAHRRLASTEPGPQGPVGDKGTTKEYNKDGTDPKKNLMYLGLGVVGLGAVYAMFSSKPKKVAGQAKQQVSEEVARQRAAR
ncbi:uncharacterized protein THITE_2109450 [Thermothielavioides terrestris NRRL 8126]|uniref:Uncharacterized protein n=1 Tax=Thermothielavioides terrestris (strain ATCC 38088 / NRRL 8126) TaxID=578455 RepID=G2QVR9_THETT|nr:uncharacterized protein THITE_2109450 [Thermothielavioides terrestris NRRL 8126]AEO63850.1 hypothetical protein THITE_2109450 [Thermothielavioides terrestris NRRL 8126]